MDKALVLKENKCYGLFYGKGFLHCISYSPSKLNEQKRILERLYSIAYEWELDIQRKIRQLNSDFCNKQITAMEYNLGVSKLKSDINLKYSNIEIREVTVI